MSGDWPLNTPSYPYSAAGTSSDTRYIEDGHEVFPCRCGKTHRGEYAFEDWNHHTCFHGHFWAFQLNDGDGTLYLFCSDCGAAFRAGKPEEF